MTFPFRISAVLVAVSGLAATTPAVACSVCGCMLNSDWASQGYKTGPGLSIDARFDFANQTELRSGSSTVDRASLSFPNAQEVQHSTINRVTTVALDYAPNGDWGFSASLPYAVRSHETIGEGDTDPSFSRSAAFGDLKLVGRYQGFLSDSSVGILFGVKLPTGSTSIDFFAGPQQGQPVDRGLQPGTGTTDLIVGAYHFGQLSENVGYFVQGIHQAAMNSHDEFKPGAQTTLSLGARYMGWAQAEPSIQLNVRHETRESGANADVDNSGATLVYLSPGIGTDITHSVRAYAFVQVPVLQHVNGMQLEPHYTLSAGMSYQF